MTGVLVLSPHPDDESIGCGGTICGHVAAGDRVKVVFLTSGERGVRGAPPEQTALAREKEAIEAAEVLGIEAVEFWREPDGALRASAHLVRRLLDSIVREGRGVVYVTHAAEDHADHRAAARLLRRALSMSSVEAVVWQYEVWTPLQRPDRFVDVSGSIDRKLAAIRRYRSQCEIMRFDEACLGLNRYRGEMHSWPGGDYAEAFAAFGRDETLRRPGVASAHWTSPAGSHT